MVPSSVPYIKIIRDNGQKYQWLISPPESLGAVALIQALHITVFIKLSQIIQMYGWIQGPPVWGLEASLFPQRLKEEEELRGGVEEPAQLLLLVARTEKQMEVGRVESYTFSGPKVSLVSNSQLAWVVFWSIGLQSPLPQSHLHLWFSSFFCLGSLCLHQWYLETHMWVRVSAVSFLDLSLLIFTNL